jgi:hypothetical protein
MSLIILLIEADENLHAEMRAYLDDQGHRVTPCWSIDDADKVLSGMASRSLRPDVIVSNTDGMAFFVKARQRFPGTRWIVTARPLELPQIGYPLTTSVGRPVAQAAASDIFHPDELPTTQPPFPIARGV